MEYNEIDLKCCSVIEAFLVFSSLHWTNLTKELHFESRWFVGKFVQYSTPTGNNKEGKESSLV